MYHRLLSATYCIGVLVLVVFGGGTCYLLLIETPAASESLSSEAAVSTTLVALIVWGVAASSLAYRNRRRLLYLTTLLLMISTTTIILCEAISRQAIPPWPASALHGVDPADGGHGWGWNSDEPGAVGLNSWGQRDRERTIQPAPGVRRIAFIGDSFLEETPQVPVSLQVERLLSSSARAGSHPRHDSLPAVEVLNLGVSATGPEEYYYRTKHVAIPLGASHCVWFVFAGNDFVEPPRTLEGYSGIVAVSPRGSWCSALGLRGLNHIFTNQRRPVLQAWSNSGDLAAQEKYLHRLLQEADDVTARHYLLNADSLSREQRIRLSSRLESPGIDDLLAILRDPDEGRFRSYYLSAALWAVADGELTTDPTSSYSIPDGIETVASTISEKTTLDAQWSENSEELALYWVRKGWELCRDRNIEFTLVIVPEAFQVDSRMREQWLPLSDMRYVTAPCRAAAERLRESAAQLGIPLLDLHDLLQDVPGTYLNLDGHWSEAGAEQVAKALALQLAEN